MTKTSARLTLLDLLLGQSLSLRELASLELHVTTILSVGVNGGASGGGSSGGSSGGNGGRDSRARGGLKAGLIGQVAGSAGDLAVDDPPLLRAERGDELLVMGDDNDTTLELADGVRETTKGLAIEVIGRLVEDEEMGVVPHGAGDDDLDLLTTGHTTNLVVLSELGVHSDVDKVLTDVGNLELTETETLAGRLVIVKLLDELGEPTGDEGFARNHGVGLGAESDPLDLVLERLLPLLTTDDVLDAATAGSVAEVDGGGHLGLVLGGELTRSLHEDLAIVTVGVTPLKVLRWGLVEMVLERLERVLREVSNTQVGVLLDTTFLGHNLTGEDLDEGGLSGTVATENGDTGRERERAGDVLERGIGSTGVLEAAVGHLDDGTSARADTHEETGRRELELDRRLGKGVVGLALGADLDEGSEVALVVRQLLVLVVNDVRANLIEETGVVGHDQGGDVGVLLEVILEPFYVANIQVISRFVEQQDLSLLQHSLGERKLHLPTTGKLANLEVDTLTLETNLTKSDLDLLTTILTLESLSQVVGNERLADVLDNGKLVLITLRLVLDEASAELVLGGETLELALGDSPHQCGLSSTVAAAETVTMTTVKAHLGVVEQHHTTVGKRELGVDDLGLTLVLIGHGAEVGESDMILLASPFLDVGSDSLSTFLAGGEEVTEVRGDAVRKAGPVADDDSLTSHGGNVRSNLLLPSGDLLLLDGRSDLERELILDFLDRDALTNLVGSGGTGAEVHGLLHNGVGAVSELTDLGQGGGILDTLDTGLETRQELTGLDGIVNELGKVLHHNDRLAEHFLRRLRRGENTLHERGQERENGRSDGVDESRLTGKILA